MLVELLVNADEVLVVRFTPQLGKQEAHALPGGALRLKQERGACRTSKLFQQMEQERGLAHPGLSDQGQESESRFNAVEQRRQGFAMRRTEIEESWIGRNPEWLFSKTKEFQKHKYRSLLVLNALVGGGMSSQAIPWFCTSRPTRCDQSVRCRRHF